jgi:hypothetical protein
MCIDNPPLHFEVYVRELLVVKEIGLDVVNHLHLVLLLERERLQVPDVEDVEIVEPLVAVEAPKNINKVMVEVVGVYSVIYRYKR